MCIGAYAAGWATCNPAWKQLMLTGLPVFLREEEYPFLLAVAGGGALAAVVALIVGFAIMRLSGIAASIATFAFLAIVNSVYSNWDSVTARNQLDHRHSAGRRPLGGAGLCPAQHGRGLRLPEIALWPDAESLAR